MTTPFQYSKITAIKKWILSKKGSHTIDSKLGIFGIWVDPTTGNLSVRNDFINELVKDDQRLLDLYYETTRKGMRW